VQVFHGFGSPVLKIAGKEYTVERDSVISTAGSGKQKASAAEPKVSAEVAAPQEPAVEAAPEAAVEAAPESAPVPAVEPAPEVAPVPAQQPEKEKAPAKPVRLRAHPRS
jgi:activator of HSP90 ATPase